MLNYYSKKQPEYLIEDWPGKYETFSWIEFAVTIPNAIFVVTTLKENGMPNANIQSWGLMLNEGESNHFLMAILRHQHTYSNIIRNGEWCINYLPRDRQVEALKTIQNNTEVNDEIVNSGLTPLKLHCMQTPGISESKIVLECKLKWHKALVDNSRWELFCGEICGFHLDDSILIADPEKRIANLNLMYNVRGTVNPVNGDYYGPNTLGILNSIEKCYDDCGDKYRYTNE